MQLPLVCGLQQLAAGLRAHCNKRWAGRARSKESHAQLALQLDLYVEHTHPDCTLARFMGLKSPPFVKSAIGSLTTTEGHYFGFNLIQKLAPAAAEHPLALD